MEKVLPPIDRGARTGHGDAYCRNDGRAGLSIQFSLRSGVRDSGSLSGDWVQGREKRVHRQARRLGEPRGPKPHATCQIHKLARGAWGTSFGLGDFSNVHVWPRDCWRGSWVREGGRWRTDGDRGLRGYLYGCLAECFNNCKLLKRLPRQGLGIRKYGYYVNLEMQFLGLRFPNTKK
jgi:hypothetical protein